MRKHGRWCAKISAFAVGGRCPRQQGRGVVTSRQTITPIAGRRGGAMVGGRRHLLERKAPVNKKQHQADLAAQSPDCSEPKADCEWQIRRANSGRNVEADYTELRQLQQECAQHLIEHHS